MNGYVWKKFGNYTMTTISLNFCQVSMPMCTICPEYFNDKLATCKWRFHGIVKKSSKSQNTYGSSRNMVVILLAYKCHNIMFNFFNDNVFRHTPYAIYMLICLVSFVRKKRKEYGLDEQNYCLASRYLMIAF